MGGFFINLPIPSNGDYILILKFADTCLNEIGTRIFDRWKFTKYKFYKFRKG